MPAQSNKDMFEKIKADVENSKGLFVVDYRGLSVKQTQDLRRSLTEAGAHMKVYKNNIVRIVLEQMGQPDISETLKGTCAYVFFDNDPVEAAKVIKEQAKTLQKLEFVSAIADGQALDAEGAKAYAELPGRDELLAQLVYVITSPLSGIAQVTAGPARAFATVVKAIADQKEAA